MAAAPDTADANNHSEHRFFLIEMVMVQIMTMTFYFSHQDGDGDMKEINGDHLELK